MKILKTLRKRGLALFLVLTMCVSLLPATAMAEDLDSWSTDGLELICDKEEHSHTDGCYATESRLTCEMAENHVHDNSCYTAGKPVQTCDSEEEGHVHTEACYVPGEPILTCGTEENHTHGEDCFEVERTETLTCELEEHVHSEECCAVQAQNDAACSCESKCTEGKVNSECPVCGVEGADLTACVGEEETSEEEAPSEPISFDEETGTLTITGMETVSAGDVSAYKAKAQKVVITDVGTIVKEAFAEFKMSELEIRNVEYIGYSFRSCTKLENLVIDQVGTIDTYAFYNPASLQSVTISNVGSIGENVFNVYGGATALTNVSLSSLSVGSRMFAEHKNLTNLTLTNIGTIGFQAFMNCSGLEDVNLESVDALGTSAFLGCTGLTELNLNGVEIGTTAFYGCTGLESVTVKDVAAIGNQAFTGCTGLKTVEMDNVGTIGEQAFSIYGKAVPACTALETVTLNNVGTIGQYAFRDCTGLKDVTMGPVRFIDNYAFWNCSGLTTIDSLSNVTERIGGFAFYGCKSLTGLTVADLTKMGYVGSNEDIMARVQAILAGTFKLDSAEAIIPLTPAPGWASTAMGVSENWNQYNDGTQIMEQTRWTDGDSVVAEVKVDAYYTAQQQMDYIFVADLSASMAQLGNAGDSNARFYDMQSKLLDMAGQLLTSPGYDCRVAIVTFGGLYNGNATRANSGFMTDAAVATDYINKLEPLNENTDYGLGLSEALELAASNTGRRTVVVFLSDGRPTYDGDTYLQTVNQLAAYNSTLTGWAEQIKGAGAEGIYGVLHSPDKSVAPYAEDAMNAVCDSVYRSTDTESFGKAMNEAFTAVYPDHTVTIPVSDNFENVTGLTVSASAGEAVYDPGTHTITWNLTGMPFTQHTLTYTMTLRSDLADRYGTYTYDVNGGAAAIDGGASISAGTPLQLTRTVNQPAPVVPTPPAPVNPVIPDPVTPLAPAPTPGDVTIDDEETPLANAVGLNDTDHFAYIIGYEDDTVRPLNNITRAEAVTIFFRLMTDEYRAANWSTENSFSDVNVGQWYNNAVSTCLKAGALEHFAQDAAFLPNQAITRAEFASIAAGFVSDEITGENVGDFSDTEGHWAALAIRKAVEAGWINGVGGNRFAPDETITRAEVMTMINRMLDRVPDAENMLPAMKKWSDNPETAWYYAAVQEATNEHDYERDETGITETWTELKTAHDWKALEEAWAANGGSTAPAQPAEGESEAEGSEGETENA